MGPLSGCLILFFTGGTLLSAAALVELPMLTKAACGLDTLFKSVSPFFWGSFLMCRVSLPCFYFCLWGWTSRGSRNPCQQELEFSAHCQAYNQRTGPISSWDFWASIPGLSCLLPPKEVQEKQGMQRVWSVWASPSSAYIWVCGCEWQYVQLRCLGGAAQHPHKAHACDVTQASPAQAYFCEHACFSMPWPTLYLCPCPESGESPSPAAPRDLWVWPHSCLLNDHLEQWLVYSKHYGTALSTLSHFFLITAL